jgi:peptide deformylase
MRSVAIRKIAQMGEPVLRRRAETVDPAELGSVRLRNLIEDMIDTMHDADGAGLAAPQIYEPLQLCVIEVNDNPRFPQLPPIPLTILVNPIITPLVGASGVIATADAIEMYEGCLSVSGMRGKVRRPRKVRVQALDQAGSPLDFVWEGYRAAVVQHEVDHLYGTLYVDRVEPRTLIFIREYDRHVPLAERVVDAGKPMIES